VVSSAAILYRITQNQYDMKTRLPSNFRVARTILAIITVLLMIYSLTAEAQHSSKLYRGLEVSLGETAIHPQAKQKKIKKKFIKLFQPYVGHTRANGFAFAFENGDQLLFYHTNIDWNFSRGKEIGLWDIAFKLAENLNCSEFLQSGFHARKPGVIYYMNVSLNIDEESCYATLAFSEYKGKMLYKLYISRESNIDKWQENAESIMKNSYAMN
jgi:hypothetical protein